MVLSALGAVNLVAGLALLAFGRKLFWLFVGAAGFLTGIEISGYFQTGSASSKLLIALATGVVGIIAAILFYRFAVALAGFAIGGFLALNFIRYLSVSLQQPWDWALYILAGIVGAVLILSLLDWTLIALSSMAGALLITHNFPIRPYSLLVFAVLAAAGIFIQAKSKLNR
jgi:hypothetical protein